MIRVAALTLLLSLGAAGFDFYGVNHTEVFLNANGNLTFGAADTDFGGTDTELLDQEPRIAPMWADVSPNISGSITVCINRAPGSADRMNPTFMMFAGSLSVGR